MESRGDSPLPIIGTERFNLTADDVLAAIDGVRNNLIVAQETLNDPNEITRRFAQNALPRLEKKLDTLTSRSPEGILAEARGFYDKTVALAQRGLTEQEIAEQVAGEFPNLPDYYELLKRQGWGYRLGQCVKAVTTILRKDRENT